MTPRTGIAATILFFAVFLASCHEKSVNDRKVISSPEKQPTFQQFVAEIPFVNNGVELRSNESIEHVDMDSPYIPEGAALVGKLKSRNGHHFIIYSYPADVRLPILEVYNNDGKKVNEKQLYHYGNCPVTNSGNSTAIIKNEEIIILQTFCDVYDSKFDSDTLFVSSLLNSIQSKKTQEKRTDTILFSERIPDFFKIPNLQFNKFKTDGANWFISSDGASRLYVVPYSDYAVTEYILTNKEISDSKLLEVLASEGISANAVEDAITIDGIISKDGIQLGMNQKEIEAIFGSPDPEKDDTLRWQFSMREESSEIILGKLQPIVMNGLNFFIEMHFENNRLVLAKYMYEIP